MSGLGDAITREDIKEMLSAEFKVNIEKDGGDIAFITYEKGGAEALVSHQIAYFFLHLYGILCEFPVDL
jgi:hypothetical protein